jgi:hypothetical protein
LPIQVDPANCYDPGPSNFLFQPPTIPLIPGPAPIPAPAPAPAPASAPALAA